MNLSELTNILQNWCHDGYASMPVELVLHDKGHLTSPVKISIKPKLSCIELHFESKEAV